VLEQICAGIEQSALATAIAQSVWLFPTIESLHVMGLAVVFGSISMLDLRLLGVTHHGKEVGTLAREVIPWTWVGFLVAATTGSLMFISAATKYLHLWPFQAKMLLLVAAGFNMIIFHLIPFRNVATWGHNRVPPLPARIAGGLSLLLWTGILSAGRIIGFL
jgi:hypothetical protein